MSTWTGHASGLIRTSAGSGRNNLSREYFCRVKMVLRTELYGRNKVLAINGLALPVLTYSFGVIHWRTTDLQQLDRRTRKLLTMHGVHHPSADVMDCFGDHVLGCGHGPLRIKRHNAISEVIWHALLVDNRIQTGAKVWRGEQ